MSFAFPPTRTRRTRFCEEDTPNGCTSPSITQQFRSFLRPFEHLLNSQDDRFHVPTLLAALDTSCDTADPAAFWRSIAADLLSIVAPLVAVDEGSLRFEQPSITICEPVVTMPAPAANLQNSPSFQRSSPSSLQPSQTTPVFRPSGLVVPGQQSAAQRRRSVRNPNDRHRYSVFFTTNKSRRASMAPPTPMSPTSPTAMLTKADVGDEEDDGSYTINQHVVLMPLGHGTQGEVVLAMDTVKNELRAIKAVPRPKGIHNDDVARGALGAAKAARRQQLEREIAIMKHCRHRNLVALHEVIDDPDLDVMYLVMQYVDKGPIAKLRDDWTIEKPIDPVKLAAYTVQLCAGLSYLHRKGVIHRDIKPDNVLIGSRDDVYLADFGTSDIFRGDESRRVLGHRGTAAFMAPELLSDEQDGDDDDNATDLQKKGEAVDIWALGITLYVLLYGKLPWTSTTPADLSSEIIDARIPLSREQSSLVPGLLPASANHSPCKYSLLKFEPRDTSTPTPPQSALRDAAYVRPGPITPEDSTVLGNSTAQISISDSHVVTSQPSDTSLNLSPADKAWARLLGDILRKEPRRRLALAQISVRAQQIIEQHQLAKESSFDPKNESSSMFMSSDAIVLRRVAEEDDDIVVALKIPA